MAISFKNPQLAKLTETPESKTYTVAVVTVVVVVLLLFFAIRPSVSSVFDKLNANEDKREFINKMEQKQQNLVALTNKETEQSFQLELLDVAFPQSRKGDEVLDTVSNIAESNSLSIRSVDMDISNESPMIESALDVNTDFAIITISASGSRTDIWSFVEDLENSNRIYNIRQVGVRSRIDASGNVSDIYDTDIAFEIFFYNKTDVQ